MSAQGYITYNNLTSWFLAYNFGVQYGIITAQWNDKLIHILDQDNQIIQPNLPQNKPVPISSFVYKDTIYIYTPNGILTKTIKDAGSLKSYAKRNFPLDEQNNDNYLLISQTENRATHDFVINAMFSDLRKTDQIQLALIMDNRAKTSNIQETVKDLGVTVQGINKRLLKLEVRVTSLEKFRDNILSGKIHIPSSSNGLSGFLSGIGNAIVKGINGVGNAIEKGVNTIANTVSNVVNGAKELVEKVTEVPI